VIQNLCFDTMLRIRLYIESHQILYMRGLYIEASNRDTTLITHMGQCRI
jgi:hypothetical protein